MRQLGGVDASFLYMETPETPMHVAGLTLYTLPEGFEGSFHAHFKKFFEGRMHLVPIFSKKLARTLFELDHPGWVDSKTVDMDYHIRAAQLPKPGTFEQLQALVGDLHGVLLDRTRPLWQFTVIEGLENGQAALYSKVHHAAVDGGSGIVITKALYDVTPVPREVPPPVAQEIEAAPSPAARAVIGLNGLVGNLLRQHLTALEAGAKSVANLADMVSSKLAPPEPKQDDGKPPPMVNVAGKKRLGQITAPKTMFNVSITGQRIFAARTLSLDDAKVVSKATGTTINDVVMAICAGALRRYLGARKKLPKQSLVAFVPISLRELGNTEIRNQVFGMNCELATDIVDPLERLMTIKAASKAPKTLAGATKDVAPQDFTLLGAPLLLPGLMQMFGRTGLANLVPMAVNLVISNTMGPPTQLYCAGAKVDALYPVSIPIHGVALNMTVQSYNGRLDFGLTADRKAVPDLNAMADHLGEALAEMKAAVVSKVTASEKAKAAKAAAAAAVAATVPVTTAEKPSQPAPKAQPEASASPTPTKQKKTPPKAQAKSAAKPKSSKAKAGAVKPA